MDLSSGSYIIINIPNTLKFMAPSCSVTNIQGEFSQFMSCSRDGQQVTLYQPFSSQFFANQSGELQFTLEEFLMPTSIREIGMIKVITYDKRGGQDRPIDMFEYDKLQPRSGAITKLSEVESESKITGLID